MILTSIVLASDNPLNHVVEHRVFTVPIAGGIDVSNHVLMLVVAAAVMLVIFPVVARQRTMVPHGLRNFFESICAFIRDEVARPVLGDDTDRFIPYLWTTFFFILLCNLLGMVPTGAIIRLLSGNRLQHLGGTATANIWVTGTLAIIAFVMIHVSGVRQQGLLKYLKNFIPHVPLVLMPMMYALEFAGAMVKPFALAIRLFANMLAGHTVLGALLGLAIVSQKYSIASVTVLGCAILSILELFVAFLQAYIFTFLTTMFIGAAVHPDH